MQVFDLVVLAGPVLAVLAGLVVLADPVLAVLTDLGVSAPTGNLDSKTSQEIMEMFHELHDQGNTIVLITHDNDIAKQAPRSIHILDGKVTEVTM